MDNNEWSQPASKSFWDSQDIVDISMVLKMANFRESTGPRWVKNSQETPANISPRHYFGSKLR